MKLELNESALAHMRKMLQYEDDRWAVYQNVALDSSTRGELQYLLVGKNRTHKKPPPHMPDTSRGLGWKWNFIGWVDVEKEEVIPLDDVGGLARSRFALDRS